MFLSKKEKIIILFLLKFKKKDMKLKSTAIVPILKFDNEENISSNNNIGEKLVIAHKDTVVEG